MKKTNKNNFIFHSVSLIILAGILILCIYLITKKKPKYGPNSEYIENAINYIKRLGPYMTSDLNPPKLEDIIKVYVSAGMFEPKDFTFAFGLPGWAGIANTPYDPNFASIERQDQVCVYIPTQNIRDKISKTPSLNQSNRIKLLNNIKNTTAALEPVQMQTLQRLAFEFNIPWLGIAHSVEKLNAKLPGYGNGLNQKMKKFHAYIPERDGVTMETLIIAITNSRKPFSLISKPGLNSGENAYSFDNVKKLPKVKKFNWSDLHFQEVCSHTWEWPLRENTLDKESWELWVILVDDLIQMISIAIGAGDLYGLYSNSNSIFSNLDGIQGDAGALSETGTAGGRGIIGTIFNDQKSVDFGQTNNPMGLMDLTSKSSVFSTVNNVPFFPPNTKSKPEVPSCVWQQDVKSAPTYTIQNNLPELQNILYKSPINNQVENAINIGALTNNIDKIYKSISIQKMDSTNLQGMINYGSYLPLPPLQVYWSTLGKVAYFSKHLNKNDATTKQGFIIPELSYTVEYLNFQYYPQDGFIEKAQKLEFDPLNSSITTKYDKTGRFNPDVIQYFTLVYAIQLLGKVKLVNENPDFKNIKNF